MAKAKCTKTVLNMKKEMNYMIHLNQPLYLYLYMPDHEKLTV